MLESGQRFPLPRVGVILLRLIPLVFCATIAALAADTPPPHIYLSLPLWFEGSGDSYLSRGPGYALSVSPSSAMLAVHGATVRMRMIGSRATARLEALDPLAANATYFVGNSEGKIFQTYGQVLSRSI